jgi:hypothetical protein
MKQEGGAMTCQEAREEIKQNPEQPGLEAWQHIASCGFCRSYRGERIPEVAPVEHTHDTDEWEKDPEMFEDENEPQGD